MSKHTVSTKGRKKSQSSNRSNNATSAADVVINDAAESIERALDMAKLRTHLAKMDMNDLASDAAKMFGAANRRFKNLRGDVATIPAAILWSVGNSCLRLREKIVH